MKLFFIPEDLLRKIDSLLHDTYDGTVWEGVANAVTVLLCSNTWTQTAQQLLLPALRQFKHNDGSEGFVPGYDLEETNEIVQKLIRPETSLWIVYDPEKNEIIYSASFTQACYDHINNSLNHGCFEAANWVIRLASF